MPLYDYKCKACGYEFEDLKSMGSSEGPFKCPKCKAKRAARVLFKGGHGPLIQVQHDPGSARLNRGKVRR